MPKIDVLERSNSKLKVRQITLALTEDCNLRCRYCYEPNKSRDHYMDLATAKKILYDYTVADDGFETVQFDFFGGEPMMAFNLIREAVDWFHTQPWPKNHIFYIGTNGTILTNEMKDWLVKNKGCVHIGVSLDGNKQAHDINRSNSYNQVMQNLPFYREHWPNQPVKMTISAETIPYVADSIISLEEMEIPSTANVVFENIWGAPEQKIALLKVYEQQLDRLVEYYTTHSELFPALLLDRRLEYVLRSDESVPHLREDTRWCGAGIEMLMFDTNGNQFPCHRFSPWVTGRPAPAIQVNQQKQWKPDKCAECRLVEMCPVCAGFNWQENSDPEIRTTYHCEAFKLEVMASAKLQVARLMQKTSQDVINLPREDVSNIQRQIDMIFELVEEGL